MLKKPRKILAMLLIGILAVSVFPLQAFAWSAPTTDTDWKPLSHTGIKARFAVGSDIHIGSNSDPSEKYENALNVFYTIDPDTDAVIFAGDITQNGYETQYDTLMDVTNDSDLSDKIIWSMGNHEFYGWSGDNSAAITEFETKTGQNPNSVYKKGGITIITLGASSSGGDYTGQYDFLKNALENAVTEDANAPIFVIAHHSVKDTAYVSDEWYGKYGEGTAKDMVALMAQYPQVIHISGHSHGTLEDERSIDQRKGFTCIQDGTLGAYFENESGKVNSAGSHETVPEYADEASQALLIDVDNNNKVTIKRMNLTSGKYLYDSEPWVIDVPALVGGGAFLYTDVRKGADKAPVFPSGAKLTVTKAKDTSVAFSFSQATAIDGNGLLGDSNDSMVHSYKMKVTNAQTGEAIKDTKYDRDYYLRFSDYYRTTPADELSAAISGLSPDTEYKIEVWAMTSYEVESSNSISTIFTTEAESDSDAIPTAVAKLTNAKPVIDGELESSIWSFDNAIQTGITGNPKHQADFDTKWDKDKLYVAVKVTGDTELKAGTAWSAGDIVWLYIDPTLHAGDYTYGDGQLGIGYNPDDKNKPYLIMGGGVLGSDAQKTAVLNSITAATVATADGWNVELAIPWQSLGINTSEKKELGFDITVDDYHKDEDLTALAWCVARDADTGSLWKDTSGFGKLELEDTIKSVLDVDFSDGTPTDKSSAAHTAVIKGSPVISDNSDLGKKVASFDGDDDAFAYNLTASDYAQLKNSFTMECMMKLNEYVNGDPFSNCDSSGLGFELNSDGNTLEFWPHINGSYTKPTTDISKIKNGWLEATATYDGSQLKLYINGKLKDTKSVTGSLDIPDDPAKWLMIGSDTSGDGNVQYPIACDISNARLFSGAMASSTIAKLYAKDNAVRITLSNNNALTGTVGQSVTIPSATARDANNTYPVTTAATGPDGKSVTISSNVFTPAKAGTYTITYTAQGQTLTKTVAVSEASHSGSSGGGGHHHHSSGTPTKEQTTDQINNTTQPENSGELRDVSNHWARKAIDYVVDKGILKGTGEGKFDPDKTMTRGMIATVLWRMGGSPAAAGTQPFPDVSSDAWYKDAVLWAAANQIASGTGNGFAPNGNVTREQLAVILYNYAKYAGLDTTASGDISGYSDSSNVSSWADGAMKWAVGTGLITGKSKISLSPQGASTRAEVATILMRFMVKTN